MDDFSKYPKSITELKADKTAQADTWTPRDALVQFLRRLDAGDFPDMNTLVIIGVENDNQGGTKTHYNVASPNLALTLGAIELGRLKMHADGEKK